MIGGPVGGNVLLVVGRSEGQQENERFGGGLLSLFWDYKTVRGRKLSPRSLALVPRYF